MQGKPLSGWMHAEVSIICPHKHDPAASHSLEKRDSKTRYWYVGLGCSLLVASLYFIERLKQVVIKREVRVFEGFISFKERKSGLTTKVMSSR